MIVNIGTNIRYCVNIMIWKYVSLCDEKCPAQLPHSDQDQIFGVDFHVILGKKLAKYQVGSPSPWG